MYPNLSDGYQSLAEGQLRFIREYSPNACAVLEKIRPYGSKAVYQSAFTVEIYKSLLEFTDGIPEDFDLDQYVQDCPEALPLLDQAITNLLEDWLCGNVKRRNLNG